MNAGVHTHAVTPLPPYLYFGSFTAHFYTFRPPAPTVRTGTADAERWSGRPRMVCGKGVRVPFGIGSRFRPLVVIASPQPKAPLGSKIDLLGHCGL